MAFSDIENSEKLDIIDIAIIENEGLNNNVAFKTVFETLSDENNEDRMFNTKYVSEEEAKKLLEDDEIAGYIKIENNEPQIVVETNGINETILKAVVDEILQTGEIVSNIIEVKMSKDPILATQDINMIYAQTYENITKIKEDQQANLENISNQNLSYTMIEYYTLIAMACLYGGILGVAAINKNIANMSPTGKRVSMTPTSKGKIIISTVCASYLVQLIGLALLFLFTIFILKVDYGNNLLLIILLALAGSAAGLTLGIAIGTIIKTNENMKTGIIISLTMFGCFLSGMMGITMKYTVDKNVPIINKLNPASMITDGFYSLYYYNTLDRFMFNVISLLVFSGIMMVLSFISLRRQKYDSI